MSNDLFKVICGHSTSNFRRTFDSRSQVNTDSFPKSKLYKVGNNLIHTGYRSDNSEYMELGIETLKRGAESGCVICMDVYIRWSNIAEEKMTHHCYPWYFEGAIRGNIECMRLMMECCFDAMPTGAPSLIDHWSKMITGGRKRFKGNIKDMRCVTCPKEPTLLCGICRIASYCSKECQLLHWNEGNHIGECRQFEILNKYHKPHAKDIYRKIIRGDDPSEIRIESTKRRIRRTIVDTQ
jgi:hypothetical protein